MKVEIGPSQSLKGASHPCESIHTIAESKSPDKLSVQVEGSLIKVFLVPVQTGFTGEYSKWNGADGCPKLMAIVYLGPGEVLYVRDAQKEPVQLEYVSDRTVLGGVLKGAMAGIAAANTLKK